MPLLPGMGGGPLTARRIGRASARVAAGALLLAAAEPVAGPQTPDGRALPAVSPKRAAGFGDARFAIETYLAQVKPRPRGTHHFCAVAYRFEEPGDRHSAYVHWVEGRRLILWEPEGEHYHGQDLSLHMSRRNWDLVRDVQDHPDPYRMTDWIIERSFADAILADCARVGETVTVTVPQPGTPEARLRKWRDHVIVGEDEGE